MKIIGLNAFHGDSSACLFVDGEMVAAVEEERFRRLKHWAGFPSMSIQYCLESQKLQLSDIDFIAINTNPKAARAKKIRYVLSGQSSLALIKEKILVREKRKSIDQYLLETFPSESFTGKVEYVEHHLAHLASTYNVSPYQEASIISVDGFGDFASAAWGFGSGQNIDVQKRIYFPHSLGIFYQAMTQYLGFPHYGDEYKVMGLAPYGKLTHQSEMDQIVSSKVDGSFVLNLDYFQHHKNPIGYEWENGMPQISTLFTTKLVELLGPVRNKNEPLNQHHYDLARSIQDAYERNFFNMLNVMHSKHKVDNLTISGGCGMNSVANGKVHLKTLYKNIYVQSAAGDAGGAIGAAIIAGQRHGVSSDFTMTHSYWGTSYSDEELDQLINENHQELDANRCSVERNLDTNQISNVVADLIIEGKVIGWFQGAMEWGPRALGNRSILGDPRRADMKDILNIKIKRRESFRPFAPSVLKEHVKSWFESDADVPFMMKVFQIKAEQRKRIPAVTHVDGSGRLQTVTQDSNHRYYELIKAFYNKTGVPMLLNTSFNENEPVVCTPEEAMACFLRTNMDVLVLGTHVITRGELHV